MVQHKSQVLAIIGFLLFFFVLLFGFPTKPKDLLIKERSRSLNLQATDISILKNEAFQDLSNSERSRMQILESQVDDLDSVDSKNILIELSREWYALGQYAIAGHYAEQIAIEDESAESWGIAGTTFAIGIKQSQKEKERAYCKVKSLECLENAISLDPQNISYQLNRGIVYAEHPDKDNPMKGIMILLDLNKNFPKNVSVINNLAKFALQTGQVDRAKERIETALSLEPENKMSNCLMVELLTSTGSDSQVDEFRRKCEN